MQTKVLLSKPSRSFMAERSPAPRVSQMPSTPLEFSPGHANRGDSSTCGTCSAAGAGYDRTVVVHRGRPARPTRVWREVPHRNCSVLFGRNSLPRSTASFAPGSTADPGRRSGGHGAHPHLESCRHSARRRGENLLRVFRRGESPPSRWLDAPPPAESLPSEAER